MANASWVCTIQEINWTNKHISVGPWEEPEKASNSVSGLE